MISDSKDQFQPTVRELLRPTLAAVERLGGSAHIRELADEVSVALDLSDDRLDELIPSGGQSWFEHNMSWSRTHLKKLGLLENSSRGVWAITEGGRAIGDRDLIARYDKLQQELQENRELLVQDGGVKTIVFGPAVGRSPAGGATSGMPAKTAKKATRNSKSTPSDPNRWRVNLLDTLRRMKPDAFERLAQRLLREAGLEDVTVIGGTGDGGLDGTGTLRINLISFPVFFQCKRYSPKRPLAASHVREFRGAMSGRGEKGILITTTTFTRGARQEATRDGAPSVDLIDGQALTELLKKYELGVNRTQSGVYQVDRKFINNL